MNKLSKKYIHWKIPSPTFTPVERNRILNILFKAYETRDFKEYNDLIKDGIYDMIYPCYYKRPNGKHFSRAIFNFAKDNKHKTLYRYVYTRNQCWRMDKEQEETDREIRKINRRIAMGK